MTEDGPETIAIYARVSTADQDASRQLNELREWVADQYPDAETEEYIDVVSGAATDRAEEYHALRETISEGALDLVVVDEISRLSRLGGGEIHDFIQHALQHDTSVRDREVGLSIDIGSSEVDRAVKEMLAGFSETSRRSNTSKSYGGSAPGSLLPRTRGNGRGGRRLGSSSRTDTSVSIPRSTSMSARPSPASTEARLTPTSPKTPAPPTRRSAASSTTAVTYTSPGRPRTIASTPRLRIFVRWRTSGRTGPTTSPSCGNASRA
ncbi:hypothetical protein J2751_002902 [Halorubrum alkaliphilum]|uniref:Resolvase/invertase-type recombinase catalytic domain-containing protein n=1 Tax=Halorubrum alkaliphilum TaxID=261290 RepID=A0A8T4GJI6_9EURY|nr:recombinase family protein [Halorubrum alkaliphilum]MBP1923857.1 hypothetical protein [Halorubrum alkaliphilum]